MEYPVHGGIDFERLRDILPQELKPVVPLQMSDVPKGAGDQIVDPDDDMIFGEQAVTKMRADESGSPGYDDAQAGPPLGSLLRRAEARRQA